LIAQSFKLGFYIAMLFYSPLESLVPFESVSPHASRPKPITASPRPKILAATTTPVYILPLTGGNNNSVRLAKRPVALAAPTCRAAATVCIMGVYMINSNASELTTLHFRCSTDTPPPNPHQTRRTARDTWRRVQLDRESSSAHARVRKSVRTHCADITLTGGACSNTRHVPLRPPSGTVPHTDATAWHGNEHGDLGTSTTTAPGSSK